MKKLLPVILLLVSKWMIAQTIDLPANYRDFPATGETRTPAAGAAGKSGGSVHGWYDAEDFLRNNSVGPFENFVSLVYPDSTVKVLDINSKPSWVFTHAFGHIFDLRHENWSAVPAGNGDVILPFAQRNSYSWDSLAFLYVYRRNNPNPAIVDTAFVYYYRSSLPNQISRASIIFNLEHDTMAYATVEGLNQQRLSGTSFFKIDTVLLTGADTTTIGTNGWATRQMVLPVGQMITGTNASTVSLAPNSLFGFTVTFKPGHSYSVGDTIESRGTTKPDKGLNYFGGRYVSLTSGFPAVLRSRVYFENSLTLNNITRYGQTTDNGWSGFMPGTAFNSAIFYDAFAYVTGQSTYSVQELDRNSFAVGTAYPNPLGAGNAVAIDFANKTAAHITIDVFDLLGQKVATVHNNFEEPGQHTARFSVNLSPGTYFYTLAADNVPIGSHKFTVVQ